MNLNLGGFPPKPSRKYFHFRVKYENVWFANLSSSRDMCQWCQPWQKAAVPHSDSDEQSVKTREQREESDGHTLDNVHTKDQRVRLSLLIFPIHPPQIFNDVK